MCDCFEGPAPLTAEQVLQTVRRLAAKRPDGLMTSDQVCKELSAHPRDVDAALRELERAGTIFAAPSAGRIAIVVLGDGDEHALRRSAHPGTDARRGHEGPRPPRRDELEE